MKQFLGSLLLLAAVFGASFYAGKRYTAAKAAAYRRAELAQGAFRPSLYPLTNRSFVFVLTARNNGSCIEKTLRSIVSQHYDSYRVIYIDDASDDGSFDIVQEFVREHSEMSRFVLSKNALPLGPVANVFRAVQECADTEIVVLVEDDGWLSHEWVLSRLNQYYASPDLWLTYGQYRQYPGYALGKTEVLDGKMREQRCEAFHLKTFYASLFKQIHPSDLIDQKNELAYMFPLLEMSEGHNTFVPEVLYICSGLEKQDSAAAETIRARAAYKPLAFLPTWEVTP